MIVDTSALIAILGNEADGDHYEQGLADARVARLSAGNWLELNAVVTRRRLVSPERLQAFMDAYAIAIEPVTIRQAEIGVEAYRRFGIGSHHPARLNLGDCFAYALARATGEPLLFKGDAFHHTDVACALPPPSPAA